MLIRPSRREHTGEIADGTRRMAIEPRSSDTNTASVLLTARLLEAEHTSLELRRVLDPSVRETLAAFDRSLEASLGGPLASFGIVPHDSENDAVAAVAYVAGVLGVPEIDVLTASKVKERTFHEWKSKGRKPRLASQGRLWALVQITEDLAEQLPDVAAWLRADPRRRELFRAGEGDALAADALNEALLLASKSGQLVGESLAGRYALGAEEMGPEPVAGRRTVRRRPTRPRRALGNTP
jgi:hypothetical protein